MAGVVFGATAAADPYTNFNAPANGDIKVFAEIQPVGGGEWLIQTFVDKQIICIRMYIYRFSVESLNTSKLTRMEETQLLRKQRKHLIPGVWRLEKLDWCV